MIFAPTVSLQNLIFFIFKLSFVFVGISIISILLGDILTEVLFVSKYYLNYIMTFLFDYETASLLYNFIVVYISYFFLKYMVKISI